MPLKMQITRRLFIRSERDQPTTFLAYKSRIVAKYNEPSSVLKPTDNHYSA